MIVDLILQLYDYEQVNLQFHHLQNIIYETIKFLYIVICDEIQFLLILIKWNMYLSLNNKKSQLKINF